MIDNTKQTSLGNGQKFLLLFISLLLAGLLFFWREGVSSKDPLDSMARNSLAPEIALNNGRPTVFEFYADWCEVCREMAPSMLALERSKKNLIDIVLLNAKEDKILTLAKAS